VPLSLLSPLSCHARTRGHRTATLPHDSVVYMHTHTQPTHACLPACLPPQLMRSEKCQQIDMSIHPSIHVNAGRQQQQQHIPPRRVCNASGSHTPHRHRHLAHVCLLDFPHIQSTIHHPHKKLLVYNAIQRNATQLSDSVESLSQAARQPDSTHRKHHQPSAVLSPLLHSSPLLSPPLLASQHITSISLSLTHPSTLALTLYLVVCVCVCQPLTQYR